VLQRWQRILWPGLAFAAGTRQSSVHASLRTSSCITDMGVGVRPVNVPTHWRAKKPTRWYEAGSNHHHLVAGGAAESYASSHVQGAHCSMSAVQPLPAFFFLHWHEFLEIHGSLTRLRICCALVLMCSILKLQQPAEVHA